MRYMPMSGYIVDVMEVNTYTVIRYKCPRGCGWYRDYSENPDWLYARIVHPVWGAVSNRQGARLDILNHDCNAHWVAQARITRLRAEWLARETEQET